MTFRRFTNRTKKDEDRAEEIESHLPHERDTEQREVSAGDMDADRLRLGRSRYSQIGGCVGDDWRHLLGTISDNQPWPVVGATVPFVQFWCATVQAGTRRIATWWLTCIINDSVSQKTSNEQLVLRPQGSLTRACPL